MAGEKTEKATPKKVDEARKKGQIARSMDLTGACILLAGLLALSAFGPKLFVRMEEATVAILQLISSPEVVSREGLGPVLGDAAKHVGIALAPILAACALATLVIGTVQTGGKMSPQAIQPQFKKLSPLSGIKMLFGPHSLFEAGKGLLKVLIVGAVVWLTLYPRLDELAALVGMAPSDLLATGAADALGIAQKAAMAYLALAFADLAFQRWNHGKQLRMDKQEVKDEYKNQDLPGEVKSMIKRRQIEASRARMMNDVPTADVVVTNPTHFSVALRYDSDNHAPVVVAKGQDHIAFRIREIAREAGVAVVPDPPLARSLYASVEVGQLIPEELYQAVAQLLAYVYRVAGRRAAAGAAA